MNKTIVAGAISFLIGVGVGAAGYKAFVVQKVTCRHIGGFQDCHWGTVCPQGETWVKKGCP